VLTVLGARVVHHSRSDDRPGWLPLDDLLAASDVVSLHVPLTTETDRLIDAARIARMRPGAVLVNTARGGLVDLDALGAALAEGRLGGAGLDVFPDEPWLATHPVARRDDVVVTPHVAWLTWETLERSLDLAMANVLALRDGGALTNVVAP
jgi:phosphoglycerate dehydrogenase-like enzyme